MKGYFYIRLCFHVPKYFRESKKNMATGKIVNVKLKQVGVSFRSNPPKEESGSDVEKFISSRPAYEVHELIIFLQ